MGFAEPDRLERSGSTVPYPGFWAKRWWRGIQLRYGGTMPHLTRPRAERSGGEACEYRRAVAVASGISNGLAKPNRWFSTATEQRNDVSESHKSC